MGDETKTVSILMAQAEINALKAVAGCAGLSVSAWLVRVMEDACRSVERGKEVAVASAKVGGGGMSRDKRASVMLHPRIAEALIAMARRFGLNRHAFMQAAALKALAEAPNPLPRIEDHGAAQWTEAMLRRAAGLASVALCDANGTARSVTRPKIEQAGRKAIDAKVAATMRTFIDAAPYAGREATIYVAGWLSLPPEVVMQALVAVALKDKVT